MKNKYARKPGPNKRPKICKKSPPRPKNLKLVDTAFLLLNYGGEIPDTPNLAVFLKLDKDAEANTWRATTKRNGYSIELVITETLAGPTVIYLTWIKPPSPGHTATATIHDHYTSPLSIPLIPLTTQFPKRQVALLSVFPHYERA